MPDTIIFIVFAVIAIVCAMNVVIQSHPISSALSLIGVMISLAVLYLLLGAEFIAMAQIIVYAGAIMVLFVFVIMLLNTGGETGVGRPGMAAYLGIPSLIAFFALLCFFLNRFSPSTSHVQFGGLTAPDGRSIGDAHSIGQALFTNYLLPFEVTSVLILVAILGAIVLARKEME